MFKESQLLRIRSVTARIAIIDGHGRFTERGVTEQSRSAGQIVSEKLQFLAGEIAQGQNPQTREIIRRPGAELVSKGCERITHCALER